MKFIRAILIALAATLSLCCASSLPIQGYNAATESGNLKADMAQELRSQAVALVGYSRRTGELGAFCSAIWVSKDSILTANHCVKEIGFLVDDVTYVIDEDVFQNGTTKEKSTITPRHAFLYARDEAHDLALLRAQGVPAGHGIAQLSAADVRPGMFVQTMGMPVGLFYCYSSGDVSALRWVDTGLGEMLFVQTTAAISPGNSGGGLWNSSGRLIGVAHATFTRGQNLNLFIAPVYIKALLAAQGSTL